MEYGLSMPGNIIRAQNTTVCKIIACIIDNLNLGLGKN